MTRPAAVLFDLDGTLLDTEAVYQRAWKQAADAFGYPLPQETFLVLRSLDRPLAAPYFEAWFGSAETGERIRVKRNEFMTDKDYVAKPGAHEIALLLQRKGIPYGVCSSTDLPFLKEKLEKAGLGLDFPTCFSAKDVARGKPAPDVYLAACENLGVEPSQAIAVEDAPNGFKSALAAGLNVIYIVDLTEPDDFIKANAYKVVHRLDEITALLTD